MKHKFGSIVKMGSSKGVIVGSYKARKWVYYYIVFEDAEYHSDDWGNDLVEYVVFREDKI